MKIVAAHVVTGEVKAFEFFENRVSESSGRLGKSNYLFGPAWTDLQCNGYAGIDFNHPDTTPVEICQAVRAMWKSGCGTVLPTVITSAPHQIEHLFRVLVKAREIDSAVAECIPGFHLEGPFISPEEGARGAHPVQHIRPPSKQLWRRWQRAAGGLIRMVTIAPEVPSALPFIRDLANEGIVVAIGHTVAGASEVSDAAKAGARLSTHLGNGCPQFLHRHLNPILAQLGEDRLVATFIPDGIHLPPHVLRALVRAKTPSRSIIVTDAMAAAGAPPGRYTLAGQLLEVGPDRVVRQPGQPNFAGSALTISNAVNYFSAFTGQSIPESWIAGSTRANDIIHHRAKAVVIVRQNREAIDPVALVRGRNVLWNGLESRDRR